ncbi:MAG: hypothetical protein WBD02_11300 [Acidimicrobiia bacterium]
MLVRISDPGALDAAYALRDKAVLGSYDFVESWLASGRAVAVEESGLHFDQEQCHRFSRAFKRSGAEHLLAVSAEAPSDFGRVAYHLDSSPEDLYQCDFEWQSLNVVLLAGDGPDLAVLCTIADFLLIGGPASFVNDVVGDLRAAEAEFRDYIGRHFEVARPPLERAAKYFSFSAQTPPSAPTQGE